MVSYKEKKGGGSIWIFFPEMFLTGISEHGYTRRGRAAALGGLLLFAGSALLWWLWNITMTKIFALREITYWEAFRLMLIAALIFR
jgi:hypothetical protein